MGATVPNGWSLRVRGGAESGGFWSDPFRNDASFDQLAISGPFVRNEQSSDEGSNVSDGTIFYSFDVLIERDACAIGGTDVRLTFAPRVELPEYPDVLIDVSAGATSLSVLTPEEAALPIDIPSLALSSAEIAPVRFSLVDQNATGSITLTVNHPQRLCVTHLISLQLVGASGDFDNAPPAITTLASDGDALLMVDLAAGTEPGNPQPIALLIAGAEPGVSTLTISFAVTVPGGLVVGAFAITTNAFVEPQPD
jgi:hypothetical protein